MATYEKIKLSADSVGSGVWLGSSGMSTNIHTTGISSSALDEVWIYANNNNPSGTADIQVEIGGTNTIKQSIPASTGLVLVIPGLIACGDGTSGTDITAADSGFTGGVTIFGYVNRITP